MLYHLGAVYQGMAGVDHWYIGLTDFGIDAIILNMKEICLQ